MHQSTFMHTFIDSGKHTHTHSHTYLYVYIGRYKYIYTRIQTTHVVRKFRAFCLRESVHDCRLRVYAPRAIGNGHQPDMHSPDPYHPNDFVESAQLLFFVFFFLAYSGIFRTFFTYFFSNVYSHCTIVSLNCDSYFQCSATHVFYAYKREQESTCVGMRMPVQGAKKTLATPNTHTHINIYIHVYIYT